MLIDRGVFSPFVLRFPIGGKGGDGLFAPLDLLFDRGLHLSVRFGVAVEDIVHARHIALEVVGGHEGEGIWYLDAFDDLQTDAVATIIESLHGCEFHRLYGSHILG